MPRCRGMDAHSLPEGRSSAGDGTDGAIDQANRAYNHLHSTPDATWDKAAIVARHTSKVLRRIADRISAIVPPRPLTRAHLAYAQGWREDGLIDADIARVLRRHGYLNWNTYNPRFNRSQQSVTAYRVALIACAAKHHLHLHKCVTPSATDPGCPVSPYATLTLH